MVRDENIQVFDFFSGCGGTSVGLRDAGMQIVFALDNDQDAAATFRRNVPEAQFVEADLATVDSGKISDCVEQARIHGPVLFSACARCQPFSRHNCGQRDLIPSRGLLLQFLRFVQWHLPDMLFVENVPGLQGADESREPFGPFVQALHEIGYQVAYEIVDCRRYGVPQRRRRLVLIASLLGSISFPKHTHGPGVTPMVRSGACESSLRPRSWASKGL